MKRLMILLIIISIAFSCGNKKKLGTIKNPIVWAFVNSGNNDKVEKCADLVVSIMQSKTNLFFDKVVFDDYSEIIKDLTNNPPTIHITSLPTFSYILAADNDLVKAALVAVRNNSPTYRGQLIVHSDSNIKTIADLKGKIFGRPDPLSTSGWVLPMLTMRTSGINPNIDLEEIVDLKAHESVVLAVYNKEIDVGSTYVDARNHLLNDYPDIFKKVKVIKETIDIPNEGIQFNTLMPTELKNKIVEAIIEVSSTVQFKNAFKGIYDWDSFKKLDDSYYDPFREELKKSGLGIESLN